MRIATANLLHGRSLQDGEVQSERMAQAIIELDADVIGIQEVDRAQPRSHTVDQIAYIAQAMKHGGPVSYRFVPTIIGEPGGRWTAAGAGDRPSGHELEAADAVPSYGVGLLVRPAVESWHTLPLKAAPVKSPILMSGTRTPMLLADEPRVMVAAVLKHGEARFRTVATTHLSFVPGWNIRQLKRCIAALAQLPGPRILLGDLNMPASVVARASRWNALVRAPTFPSPNPKIQFDHVVADDPSLNATAKGEAMQMTISDHRALVVDLS